MRPYFLFEYIVLISLLTVQRMPQLVESEKLKFILLILSMLPLYLVITMNLLVPLLMRGRVSVSIKKTNFRLFSFVIFLLFVSLIRGYEAGSLTDAFMFRHVAWWLTVVLFGFALFLLPRDCLELVKLRRGLYYCLSIYVAFNVLLHLVGVESAREIVVHDSLGPATVLGAFGVNVDRVLFATASGLGPFGVASGAVALFGSMLLLSSKSLKSKIMGFCILLFGLYALLRTDSRAVAFWMLVTPFAYLIGWKKLKRLLPLLPVVSLILPMLAMSFAIIVASTPLGEMLGRSAGSDNVATLSNRSVIWSNVFHELKDFSPTHLVGFGARGQVASGVGEANAVVFEGDYSENVEQKTAHNFALQTMLDMGYIGIFLWMLLLIRTIKEITWLGRGQDAEIHIVFVIYIILVGATEVVPTMYVNEAFTVVLLLIISMLHKSKSRLNMTVVHKIE